MAVADTTVHNLPQKTCPFRHVLAATDFSEPSRRALSSALVIAAKNDSRLSVVHVVHADWRYEMLDNPPELDLEQRDEQQRLQEFVNQLHPDRAIDAILIKSGPIAKTVVSAVADLGADLLVIGTHGRGRFAKLALGSVAEELLRIAPCPVMTIGPKAAIAPGAWFRTILFATDFGKGSTKAMPLAVELARTHGAKLLLLHMLAPIPTPSTSLSAFAPSTAAADEVQEWERSSRARCVHELRTCLPRDSGLEQEPDYVVGTEFLPEGILIAAEKYKVDLIIMGATHRRSPKVAAHLPWTAVHEVVRSVSCPVLTVAG